MTAQHKSPVNSSSQTLIGLLTDLLINSLKRLTENDYTAFEVPPIPDWRNCGDTLSENFAAFADSINDKLRKEAIENIATTAAMEEALKRSEKDNSASKIQCIKKGIPGYQMSKQAKYKLSDDEKWVLIISLVPHIYPHFYDDVILKYLENPGEYPQLGFVRGKDFRGFIPTGETAFFLLAGNSFERRIEIQQFFQADHFFAQKKVIWLEELTKGDPVMSGKIIIGQDSLDMLLFGKVIPPVFSINFPAKEIQTELSWGDLVINEELEEQINTIMSWLRFNDQLMNDVNMRAHLRKGYRTLFYGPSGTGKTFTAGLLGKCAGKPVYKIDLSMVVSKYIGETEKNLELLFARAEDKEWILFFDEADALFGKRTNVRDAHDKYANQEVSYLLQRIEDYNGLVILATNMKNNIDDAFMRRFNSVLRFPFPDATQRNHIWKKSFPSDVLLRKKPGLDDSPVSYDSQQKRHQQIQQVDIPEAVKKYELTGGSIKNIVHYAGIKGMEEYNKELHEWKEKRKTPATVPAGHEEDIPEDPCNPRPQFSIYLSDVMDGIRRELIKEGKPFTA